MIQGNHLALLLVHRGSFAEQVPWKEKSNRPILDLFSPDDNRKRYAHMARETDWFN